MTNEQHNTNYLKGIRCPQCGSPEPFYIGCELTVKVWDNNIQKHDINWSDDAEIVCSMCGYGDTVSKFKEAES